MFAVVSRDVTANGNKPKPKQLELKEGDVLTEAELTLDDRLDDRVLSEEERLAEERRHRAR